MSTIIGVVKRETVKYRRAPPIQQWHNTAADRHGEK